MAFTRRRRFGDSAIARGRFQPPQRETGKRLRVNDQVRISPVRLIDENEEQIGVVDLDDAKRRAKDAELDLVEVAPQARPPVCRIMDYGKWKYQQKKKETKAKSHAKQSELKEVRLRPNIDEHDLSIKMNKARDFLEEGDKVQFTMLFRGRQMVHRDLALDLMRQCANALADISKVETHPRQMGRRATMVVAPERAQAPSNKKPKAPKAEEKPKEQGEPAAAAAQSQGNAGSDNSTA